MGNRIITISREFGSGGRTIGRKTAEKLGIPCYDSELIDKIAEESQLAKDYVEEKGEQTAHSNWLLNAFSAERGVSGVSTQDYLWMVQCQVIQQLARQQSCVIIGRCADYILEDIEDCLKVFIHANPELRAKRIVEVYGETGDSPQKRIRDKDKRRKTYYRFYTDIEFGNSAHYDVCLDSGSLGIEKCVDVLCSLY